MVLIIYSDVQDVMDLSISDISAINTEKLIDLAIHYLNLYAQLDMSNMAGTAGSKTLNVTSPQYAAVLHVFRTIYHSYYKPLEVDSINPTNVLNPPDLLSNPVILESVREAARLLQEPEYSRAFLR